MGRYVHIDNSLLPWNLSPRCWPRAYVSLICRPQNILAVVIAVDSEFYIQGTKEGFNYRLINLLYAIKIYYSMKEVGIDHYMS